jgi:hypothetical protein
MRLPVKEVMLLSAPLLIIGAGIWGAQWQQSRRAAKLPRVKTCFLRLPSAHEAFQGAKVSLTCRSSWPQGNHCQPVTVISNSQSRFNSQNRNWQEISLGGRSRGLLESGRKINESDTILNLKKFVPNNQKWSAEKRLYNRESQLVAKRAFSFGPRTIPPFKIETMRHTKGEVVGIQLTAANTTTNSRFLLSISVLHPNQREKEMLDISPINTATTGSPVFSLDFDGISTGADDLNGAKRWEFALSDNGLGHWPPGMKAVMDVSIEREWPLHLEIDLPAKPPLGGKVVDLHFISRLAPIPPKVKSP